VQEARTGIDGFDGDLVLQRRHFATRVPTYDLILGLIADGLNGDLGRRLAKAWARRTFEAPYARPLLLLATLRFDALCTGPDHPLWAAVAADPPEPAAVTQAALDAAFARDRPHVWHSLTRRWVQTNEVSRSVTWLWPAALAGADDWDRRDAVRGGSIALCDLGCSAGLNLVADSLALTWGEAGTPGLLPVARQPRVVRRLGFDRSPLDPTAEDDRNWLRACVWVGQSERLERLERALAAFAAARASSAPPVIETIDARDIPARLTELSAADDSGALWLAYQTLVREYLGESLAPYLDGMREWLTTRPGRAVWMELEHPPYGATREHPAAVIAHVARPGGEILDLVIGRCYYHPPDVAPEPDAVAAFRAALL
jgi:hypothetical protein